MGKAQNINPRNYINKVYAADITIQCVVSPSSIEGTDGNSGFYQEFSSP